MEIGMFMALMETTMETKTDGCNRQLQREQKHKINGNFSWKENAFGVNGSNANGNRNRGDKNGSSGIFIEIP